MGKLIAGRWTTEWYGTDDKGHFIRDDTVYRNQVTRDGSSGYRAEPGRYHLYVSLACPWAHRTLITRQIKRLQNVVSVTVVHPHMGENGWEFRDFPGATPDALNGARYLHEIYTKSNPSYTGRVTVPMLWDEQRKTIVCNESRLIMRMLDHEFDEFAEAKVDLCPAELKDDIDREIDALYRPVNNGVYRAGFATRQSAYEDAVRELFATLDRYEARLSTQRYLFGARLTEADICLFTTAFRFDPVYYGHFKCNLRRLRDYPALWGFVRDIHQLPGLAGTCNLAHIKHHYFTSHPSINPNGIIALGPELDLLEPHGRENLGSA